MPEQRVEYRVVDARGRDAWTVPPEIKRLRERVANAQQQTVHLADAEQAVRDAEARVRDHYHTTGRALREIGDVLRNSTLTDSQKVSAIAAVMANGPLDDAPGGPCEDAAFAARRVAFREAVEALRGRHPENGPDDAADWLEWRFLTSEGEPGDV